MMTFCELMVLLRLYQVATPDLKRWAAEKLPELAEAALVGDPVTQVDHRVQGINDHTEVDIYRLICSCGWSWQGPVAEAIVARYKHNATVR